MNIHYSKADITPDIALKRDGLKQELSRLSAQEKILAGSIQQDPEFKARANEVAGRKKEIEAELENIPRGLELENNLLPLNLNLAMDPVVADWVKEVLGRPPVGGQASP